MSECGKLVDAMLLTQLIKLAKQAIEETDHILWLGLRTEVSEADYLSVQHGHHVELVEHFLVVLDALQHMLGHQLRDQLLSALNLHLNDPVIVVYLARAHLSSMDHQQEEQAVDDDQCTVRDVCLNVDRILLDVPVVLHQQNYEDQDQQGGQLSELERSAVE